MYARRIQIANYGPISQLDIDLPFEGDNPKPVLFVGENGSGKSLLLSHIVNGLIRAKDSIFPDSPEVETGKVFKIRSPLYIKSGSECYFAKVDFEEGLHFGEALARRLKEDYREIPNDLLGEDAEAAWRQIRPKDNQCLIPVQGLDSKDKIEDIFSKNCVLFLPPNRFEEPAWLNVENLGAQAKYMDLRNVEGFTERNLIDYSPLHKNKNWLLDLIYDRTVFEARTTDITIGSGTKGPHLIRPAIMGYLGDATTLYDIALEVARRVMKGKKGARFGIGKRRLRVVSLEGNKGTIVPNIFQLSSGEVSLLNMFLSVLRDFDLSGAGFSRAEDIRGIVVVDEVDLHLHAVHQYEVLPSLIAMFPRVQFIVTTHAPLFVLGMKEMFGEDGFAVYQMPRGNQIQPEEFNEFSDAYQAYMATKKHSDEVRSAIEKSQKPIVYLEGTTDIKYLQRAAKLLQLESLLEGIVLKDGKGDNQKVTWKAVRGLPSDLIPGKVVLIRDCEENIYQCSGNKILLSIPKQEGHPIDKGVENLFSKAALVRALSHKPAFIDVTPAHPTTERGETVTVPEKWKVNEDEKLNLCHWLCENGTAEDFSHFQVVFDLLTEALALEEEVEAAPEPRASR